MRRTSSISPAYRSTPTSSFELMRSDLSSSEPPVTRRAWIQFAFLAAFWGASYLFIKVALEDVFSPPVIVFVPHGAGRAGAGARS